jgi:hypothetical protein
MQIRGMPSGKESCLSDIEAGEIDGHLRRLGYLE